MEPYGYTPGEDEAPRPPKKRDPVRKRLFLFGAVTLLVCLAVSFAAGAAGSLLVLRLSPLLQPSAQPAEENTFVPEIAAPYTEPPAEVSETAAEVPTADPVPAATEPAPTQPPAKTKGEIYAEAVNSIVCVRCVSRQTVQTFFGFGGVRSVTSSGSGFFWTADGYIVTNYHVIKNADSVTVTLYDGTELPAAVAGGDAANDIAVLKTEGNFTPVKTGSSAALAVGDDVLVIGNALGELSYTFTDGVVSYLSRRVETDTGASVRMFQTNAAINEGNSGGPVYNTDGEVVGIASAKYASESVEGLGFCIPIDDVRGKIEDLIRVGYVTGMPSVGVSVQTVSSSLSMRYGLPRGCYVVAVGDGTAAAAAGLVPGDVITAADGAAVASYGELQAALAAKAAGDPLTLTAVRGGAELTFSLTLDEKRPAPARTDYTDVFDL